jgi:hypothetical protein
MKRILRAIIAASLLLVGYFSGAPLASALGDTQCGAWSQPGPAILGVPMAALATRSCTTTTICQVTADWDGANWRVNQPNCY